MQEKRSPSLSVKEIGKEGGTFLTTEPTTDRDAAHGKHVVKEVYKRIKFQQKWLKTAQNTRKKV